MSVEVPQIPTTKQKVTHELVEMTGIFLYLAFFFCALTTYSMLLLNKYDIPYYNYGAALLNALIVAKVILIGEYAHLGKRHEKKPLLLSSFYKAVYFSVLVFAFHVAEEVVKRLIHGEGFAGALQNVRFDDLAARTLIIFSTFLPLFAFRELQRVMGEEKFRDLFFKTGAADKSV
ncbi:MAG TPA: hypothetical protein VKH45_03385 [Candidatus Acidoferrum sp.]|nr:hypothetical protein [Candidatus Acidoferrum sp.]